MSFLIAVPTFLFGLPQPKQQPQKNLFSSGASKVTKPPLASMTTQKNVPTPSVEPIPTRSVLLFKKDCVDVLNSIPEKKILLTKFPVAYLKLKRESFSLAKYNAKKILLLLQEIPDVVKVSYCKLLRY